MTVRLDATKILEINHELLLGESPNCELLVDADGTILYASRVCAGLFGEADALTPLAGVDVRGLFEHGALPPFPLAPSPHTPASPQDQSAFGDDARMCMTSLRTLDGRRRPALRRLRRLQDGRMRISVLGFEELGLCLYSENADVDQLTGLGNRKWCEKMLESLVGRIKENPDLPFAVLHIDIDRLKRINDAHGPSVGDAVIRRAAARFKDIVGDVGYIARLSGDEFLIVTEEVPPREVVRLAKRIIASCADPFVIGDKELFISVSLGVVLGPAEVHSPDELIRNANIAVRQARGARHKYRVFTRKLLEYSLFSHELEVDMPSALQRGEFVLEYQPIFTLDGKSFHGVEALVRWEHPRRGRIAPNDFIPLAEESGFILPLGEWILRTACTDFRRFLDANPGRPDATVAVNLSAAQLAQFDISQTVRTALDEAGLPAANLKIEITESLAMTNPDQVIARLHEFRALGVRIAIDDFGTGYSSLSRLQSFPIDAVKVDKSFIGKMDKNSKKRKIVRSVISLAHNLKLKVIAEGVEAPEQWLMLKALDCEQGQGFLFSHPVPMETLLKVAAGFKS